MNGRNHQLRHICLPRWLFIAACGSWGTLPAMANPVILNPTSLPAFTIVVFCAFMVEAASVALLLTVCRLQPLRIFPAYFPIKATVLLFLFRPLLERNWSIPLLEFLVVCANGLAIKILAGFGGMQTDAYGKLSWLSAFMISALGNAVSFSSV